MRTLKWCKLNNNDDEDQWEHTVVANRHPVPIRNQQCETLNEFHHIWDILAGALCCRVEVRGSVEPLWSLTVKDINAAVLHYIYGTTQYNTGKTVWNKNWKNNSNKKISILTTQSKNINTPTGRRHIQYNIWNIAHDTPTWISPRILQLLWQFHTPVVHLTAAHTATISISAATATYVATF